MTIKKLMIVLLSLLLGNVALAATVTSVSISSGPGAVEESSGADYDCTVYWSTGLITSGECLWSENSDYASISSNGYLTTYAVTSDRYVDITATLGGKSDTVSILIQDFPLPTSIVVSGTDEVNEDSGADYDCTVYYDNGYSTTESCIWSENSDYASISDSGYLTTYAVTSDKSVVITATLWGLSGTKSIVIKDGTVAPSSIAITGPGAVEESSGADYDCTVYWSNSSLTTDDCSWSENSDYASISDSGYLTTYAVTSDKLVIITATFGGKSSTYGVTINAGPNVPASIAITGSSEVDESSGADYDCTVYWSDGLSSRENCSWNENSDYASISDSGYLTTYAVTSDKSIIITATFEGKSDTKSVLIKNVPIPSSVIIEGPDEVNENSGAQYECRVSWDTGSSTIETEECSWSYNATYASMSISNPGYLTTFSVTSDKSTYVTAAYGGKSDTKYITIKNVGGIIPSSITISGPDEVNEDSGADYDCTVYWTNGSSMEVDCDWGTYSDGHAWINSSGYLRTWPVDSDKLITITATKYTVSGSKTVTIKNVDYCPDDPEKTDPGECGCGTPDTDLDLDGIPDCNDTDTDGDGVNDAVENSGPNGGDANYDYIFDRFQGDVASMVTSDNQYIVVVSQAETLLENCRMRNLFPENPLLWEHEVLPYEMVVFDVVGVEPGGMTLVELTFPLENLPYENYYGYGKTPEDGSFHWYEFPYDEEIGTGAAIEGEVITLYLTDGEEGDDDLDNTNGVISVLGGPSIFTEQPPVITPSVDSGGDSGSGGCFINSLH